jgi:urease accessory protein
MTTGSKTRSLGVADRALGPALQRHSGEGRNPSLLAAASETPMDPGLRRGDENTLSPAALQKLLAWLSPSFPVGAYTYSHGLEWAIEDGTVMDVATLGTWLTAILRHGAGRSDAILFAHAWASESDALIAIAELAAAFQPSKERHLEATAQGRAFLSAVAAAWPNERVAVLTEVFTDRSIPYPVAVAACAAAHDVPLAPALTAMLTAFVANIVSAGVRAIPIGQTDGQRLIAALGSVVAEVATAAMGASLGDLGGATLRADIASMNHETQYTRLFRS